MSVTMTRSTRRERNWRNRSSRLSGLSRCGVDEKVAKNGIRRDKPIHLIILLREIGRLLPDDAEILGKLWQFG